ASGRYQCRLPVNVPESHAAPGKRKYHRTDGGQNQITRAVKLGRVVEKRQYQANGSYRMKSSPAGTRRQQNEHEDYEQKRRPQTKDAVGREGFQHSPLKSGIKEGCELARAAVDPRSQPESADTA